MKRVQICHDILTVNVSYICTVESPFGSYLYSKAQFRRRASAVPNLIAIRFDCGTAEARL